MFYLIYFIKSYNVISYLKARIKFKQGKYKFDSRVVYRIGKNKIRRKNQERCSCENTIENLRLF